MVWWCSPPSLIHNLQCAHDSKSGRIVVDKYLEVPDHEGVFAVGDCALVIDPNTLQQQVPMHTLIRMCS
jgi:NADH dehydrogenase FAD-containing subunit